jgi:hypothetical protein
MSSTRMIWTEDNVNQAIFLTSVLSGTALLVAGIVMTRLNWRRDVPPYNRRTRSLNVLLRPAKYAVPNALPVIRFLTLLGLLLLTVAVLALVRQALMQFLY